jgi:FAD/FMN-containing dehydrogenase
MDHLQADFVVNPKSEAEVIEVLRVCYAHDVPGHDARRGHRQLRAGHADARRLRHAHEKHERR